jgi:hypothetical protein
VNFWETLALIASVELFIQVILPKLCGGWITYSFGKSLEKYKQELSEKTESEKFKLNRKMKDFELYVIKRHEVYAELYQSLGNTLGYLNSIHGVSSLPTFDDHNIEDITNTLRTINTTTENCDRIVKLFDSPVQGDRDKAIEEILKLQKGRKILDTKLTLEESNNKYWIARLYLSKETDQKVYSLLADMRELQNIYAFEYEYWPVGDSIKNLELKQKINNDYNQLAEQLRNELSIGMQE